MLSPKRFRAAVLLNLLVPGAGLILLRREWLGLAMALLFGSAVEVALFGALISPLYLPFRVQVAGWAAGVVIWTTGQMLLRNRMQFLRDPDLPDQLARLRAQSAEAAQAGNLAEARGLLRLALAVDDEDAETQALWAEVLEQSGKPKEARKVWRRVARLRPDRSAATPPPDAGRANQPKSGRPKRRHP